MDLKSFNFPNIVEEKERGYIRVFESTQFPFKIKRVFSVVNTLSGEKRGEHAHKKCNQLLCCVSGKIKLICDDGNKKFEKLLSQGGDAILVPQGIWAEQTYLKTNSVLIVFCDQFYDESDYIRDYKTFLKWRKNQK